MDQRKGRPTELTMSTAQREVSQPNYEIVLEPHVKIPMRDGTRLDAMVWRPEAPGRFPVIVERVGYELTKRCTVDAEYFSQRGYVFVGQNVRGCHSSEGDYGFCRYDGWGERQDGYDTIEWAGIQPWSNGLVGMVDGSYSGTTQYLAAPTRPPHLKALFARQSTGDLLSFTFRDGAHNLARRYAWLIHVLNDILPNTPPSPPREEVRARLEQAIKAEAQRMPHSPLKSLPMLEGIAGAQIYREDLDHPEDGPYWWPLSLSRKYDEVDVPIFHFGSWYDLFLEGTLRAYHGIKSYGRSEACWRAQRLLIGPWIHGPENIGLRQVGELDFGAEAEFDLKSFRLRWYDYWLKGIANRVMDGAVVRVFLMGDNRWIDLDDWPPPGVIYTPLYFHAGEGRSATSLNNGRLGFAPSPDASSADSFVFDPADPMPSLVSYPDFGPRDYRALESRMLTYTSAPLEHDLAVIGPVKAILHASSTCADTDWVVRLCDVYPDGRSMSVCDGILRARYRNSLEGAELMAPGQVYRFEVDLWSTAQSFKAGHCIRLEVTSSDFPRYDCNLNTGGRFGEETSGQVASNTIFQSGEYPSHILLPLYY